MRVSALPISRTLRFTWGVQFRGFTTVRFRYDLSICSPSCRSRPSFRLAYEDFYSWASDGLVTRSAAKYNYGGNWTISTGGSFTRKQCQLASLQHTSIHRKPEDR